MMHLIVGRSGTGKDALRDALERLGWHAVLSRTTRPPRNEAESTHIFLTEEEADEIWDQAVATTTINGYRYFATQQDVDEAQLYIVDPNGVEELARNMPDTSFAIVYLIADPKSRQIMATKRADDPKAEQEVFKLRDESESKMFDNFEHKIGSTFAREDTDETPSADELFPSNVTSVAVYSNDYQTSTMRELASKLQAQRTQHENVIAVLREAARNNIISMDENDRIESRTSDGTPKSMSLDMAASAVISDPERFGSITLELLKSETLEKALLG